MSFYSRLKERREDLHITRTQLAKMIGVTPSAIGNYEIGLSHPKPEILYKIFHALQVDPNYLYQDEFTPIKKEVPTDEGIELYNRLDETDKAEIRGEMKHMLKADKYKQDDIHGGMMA